MTRSAEMDSGQGSSEDDDVSSTTEPLPGAPARVLALQEEAFARLQEGDVEMVDRLVGEIVDVVRRAASLPPAAWDEVRANHERLQAAIDEMTERVRAQLGTAGGGRKASKRYESLTPERFDDDDDVDAGGG